MLLDINLVKYQMSHNLTRDIYHNFFNIIFLTIFTQEILIMIIQQVLVTSVNKKPYQMMQTGCKILIWDQMIVLVNSNYHFNSFIINCSYYNGIVLYCILIKGMMWQNNIFIIIAWNENVVFIILVSYYIIHYYFSFWMYSWLTF